jgi:DNA-binding XRE family transcriptional regulator
MSKEQNNIEKNNCKNKLTTANKYLRFVQERSWNLQFIVVFWILSIFLTMFSLLSKLSFDVSSAPSVLRLMFETLIKKPVEF